MRLRQLIPFALALLLAVTSQSMAVARGAAAATGQMVICVGEGAVTVYTDAQGTPTSAPHICPDCVVSVVFVPEAPWPSPPERTVRVHQSSAYAPFQGLPAREAKPHTRAPPVFI